MSATGHYFNPGIIFKCKELQKQYFSEEMEPEFGQLYFTHSENRWTGNDVGFWWLREVLIPQINKIRKGDESRAVLLTLDGHGSHTTVSKELITFSGGIWANLY